MIDYIKIEGYKSIKELELELRPINVLIGANGAGKSNFISFFKLLNSISNKQLQRFVLEEDKADNILHFGRKSTEKLYGKIIFTEIDASLRNEQGNLIPNNAYHFILRATQSEGMFIDTEGSGFNVFRDLDGQNYFTERDIEESNILFKDNERSKYLKQYLNNIQLFHFHDTSSTSWLRKSCDIEDNYKLRSDGRNLPAFLYLLKNDRPKIYKRLLRTVKSVAPFIEDFILKASKLSENKIELRWIEKSDLESNFSAHQFSDGTIRFIALATALLQPDPPSVIIIDEPELGFHPFAIKKLAGLIKSASKKVQIIISTQSVNLVDCFEPDDIIAVDRVNSDKHSIFKRLKKEKLHSWLNDHSLGEMWQRDIINSAQPE